MTKILPRSLATTSPEKLTNRVIGSGPNFPFQFTDNGSVKSVLVASGPKKINQSIWTILSTRKGERVGRPAFGSNLQRLVFEPNDDVLWSRLEESTAEALRIWERRIRIIRVTAIPPSEMSPNKLATALQTKEYIDYMRSGSIVGIYVEYVILRTNQVGSFVYPFVLQTAPLSYGV